jgi:hypothetical protein
LSLEDLSVVSLAVESLPFCVSVAGFVVAPVFAAGGVVVVVAGSVAAGAGAVLAGGVVGWVAPVTVLAVSAAPATTADAVVVAVAAAPVVVVVPAAPVAVVVAAAPVAVVVAVAVVAVAAVVTAVVAAVSVEFASAAFAVATGTDTTTSHTSAPKSKRREDLALRIHTVPTSGNNQPPELRHTIRGQMTARANVPYVRPVTPPLVAERTDR